MRCADTRRDRSCASLAAEIGVIAFNTAFARWVSEPDEQDLSQLIRESLDQLKVIIVGE